HTTYCAAYEAGEFFRKLMLSQRFVPPSISSKSKRRLQEPDRLSRMTKPISPAPARIPWRAPYRLPRTERDPCNKPSKEVVFRTRRFSTVRCPKLRHNRLCRRYSEIR